MAKAKRQDDDIESNNSLSDISGKISKNERLIQVVSVLIILVVCSSIIISFLPDTARGTTPAVQDNTPYTEAVKDKVKTCVSENPALTEQQCWDSKYRQTAIFENEESLCDEIEDNQLRQNCHGYFK